MLIQKRNLPQLEEGEYEAELNAVMEETANFGNGESYPYVRFRFSILDQSLFGTQVDASVPLNFAEGTKLYNILKGLGVDVTNKTEVNTDELLGTKVKVYVENVVTKRGFTIPQVTKIRLLKGHVQPAKVSTSSQKTEEKLETEDIPF
jgi:hypothetical protein